MWLSIYLLLLVVAILAIGFEVSKRIRSYRRLCVALEKLPGEKAHWLLGNLAQVSTTGVVVCYE